MNDVTKVDHRSRLLEDTQDVTIGFKYVGDNYVMFNRRNGETLTSTDTHGDNPRLYRQRHLMYCWLRETFPAGTNHAVYEAMDYLWQQLEGQIS